MKQERYRTSVYYADTTLRQFTLQDIAVFFDYPLVSAAALLGVSDAYLMRQCRPMSIRRWPYRKIQNLIAQRHHMEQQRPNVSDAMAERWDQKIEEIGVRIKHIKKYGVEMQTPTKKQQMKEGTSRPARSEPHIKKEYIFVSDEEDCAKPLPICSSLFPLKLDIHSFENDPYIIIH